MRRRLQLDGAWQENAAQFSTDPLDRVLALEPDVDDEPIVGVTGAGGNADGRDADVQRFGAVGPDADEQEDIA